MVVSRRKIRKTSKPKGTGRKFSRKKQNKETRKTIKQITRSNVRQNKVKQERKKMRNNGFSITGQRL